LPFVFARTEEQSQLELRQAAALCPEVARRAAYLRHALDEQRHAEILAETASTLAVAHGGERFGSSGQHFEWRRGPNGLEGPYIKGDQRIVGGY
jgi:hypothetical protein